MSLRRRPPASGVTLVEMLLALTLGGVLSTACLSLLASVQAASVAHAERVALGEALRIADLVLGAELSFLEPGDFTAAAPDSLRIRAFRGVAIVCASEASGVTVRYRGWRLPEPAKDSVIAASDGAAAVALESVGASAADCGADAGERVQRWTPAAGFTRGDVLLVFESGTYSLGGGALRYRRGRAGRQPLGPALLDPQASFRFQNAEGADVAVEHAAAVATTLLPPAGAAVSRRARGRLRVPLINRSVAPPAPP